MNRKLEVGEVLGEVFRIYGRHAGVLLPAAFWLFLVAAIVDGIVGNDLSLFPLVIAVSSVIGILYQGMVVGLVRDVEGGREDSSIGALVSFAMPVLLPLIGAALISGIAVGVGIVLFVVPGLILLTIWAVIGPVIVIERIGVFPAFSRSRQLVRGSGWPVFGVVVTAFLISLVGGIIFSEIAAGISDGPIVRIVFSALASTITAPIVALAAGVLYYRLLAIAPVAPPPPAAV